MGTGSFSRFSEVMLSNPPKFPCIFGVKGLENEQLRYCFVEGKENLHTLVDALTHYLPQARKFGKYTSLVTFFKKEEWQTDILECERMFWHILNYLNMQDKHSWPKDIPQDPKHHAWEFCFAGEAIFVVCSTPQHQHRKIRHNETFMITFQPRWVFESLRGDTKAGVVSRKTIHPLRTRLDVFTS